MIRKLGYVLLAFAVGVTAIPLFLTMNPAGFVGGLVCTFAPLLLLDKGFTDVKRSRRQP